MYELQGERGSGTVSSSSVLINVNTPEDIRSKVICILLRLAAGHRFEATALMESTFQQYEKRQECPPSSSDDWPDLSQSEWLHSERVVVCERESSWSHIQPAVHWCLVFTPFSGRKRCVCVCVCACVRNFICDMFFFSLSEDAENEERKRMIIEQLEEEMRKLEDEMAASFSISGFDRHSSLVLSPDNPETLIDDYLAVMGERTARELDTSLAAAVHSLLTGPLDYQRFRDTTLTLSTHTQGGWSNVLAPLLLLQALQSKGQALSTLVRLGVRLLEEDEAEYITQQGGWAEIFRLGSEEEQGVTIAEDNNDIYILSGEQHPDQLSPPSSLLCTGDNSSGQSSWQTESLPVSLAGHESWAQVSAMDPEDVKSLDSNEGAALAEERSENNSSNSDIVHVEREEAELLEELAELREEFRDQTPPVSLSAEADAPASLISLEEPVVIETPVSLSAEPSLVSSEPELLPPAIDAAAAPPHDEPEPAAPLPVPAVEPDPEPEPAADAAPVPAEGAGETPEVTPEPAPEPEQDLEPAAVPPQPEEPQPEPETVAEPALAPPLLLRTPVEAPPAEEPPVKPESELSALLYGSAALVLLAAAVAYGVLSYRRK
uniref:BCL2 like 13 n=1 Tax=Scophthalmus maximus TaxID=52904 RepID=A0A8D3ECB2_SCOMX